MIWVFGERDEANVRRKMEGDLTEEGKSTGMSGGERGKNSQFLLGEPELLFEGKVGFDEGLFLGDFVV